MEGQEPATTPPDAPVEAAPVQSHAKSKKNAKAQVEQVELEDDFFYSVDTLKAVEDTTNRLIPAKSIELFHSFGFASHKRNNLHFLDEHILLSSIGNVLVFLNLKTNEQRYMMGLREGSIGAIAVHPTRTYFAVGEICESQPNIYIYEYPSLKLHRILREGAERGYSDLCFNSSGDKISSVAMDPDYMLTIWNWKKEKIILRSKAFSQDVFRVAFSPDNDGILTTSGMGHIKFWRMSSTFTGLKLQGYLGKFGATELSDIAAFIQLPDGKVLSSTETGNMLLWDGGMIKCEIGVKGRRLCHQGRIEAILLVEGEVITAGEDGLVRIWDLETIDNADVTTTTPATAGATTDSSGAGGGGGGGAAASSGIQSRVFEMEPIDEILIAKDVKIKTVVRYPESSHDYLVQDQQGHLFRLDLNKRSSDKLLSFHAGSVVGIDTSPISHIMATLGSDGSLSIYDYTSKTTLNRSKFHAGGSCLSFLPEILDSVGKTIVAGFTDGVLRIVSFTSVGMVLQHVFKPHVEPITAIAISADGRLMVTGSDDKTIFLFSVASKQSSEGLPLPFARSTVKITPLGFISVQGAVSKIAISPDEELYRDEFKCNAGTPVLKSEDKVVIGKRLLINLKDGSLYSALVSPNDAIDTALTFEIPATKLRLEPIQLYVPDATVATPLPAGAPGQQGQAADGNPASSAAPGNTQSPAQDASPGENSNGGQFGQDGSAPAGAAATSGDQQAGQQQDGQNDKLPRTKSMIRKAQGVMVSKESSVTATLYLANGFFVAGYVNSDNEAEIRLCHVLMPDRSRLLLAYKVPISDLHLSPSSTYILAGAQDGTCAMIRYNLAELMAEKWDKSHETYIQYSNRFNDRIEMALEDRKKEIQTSETTSMSTPLEVSGQHWFGHGHDILQGRVNALQTSFDESFLCSAGSDGGIFVWRITFESIKSERVFEGDLDEQSNQIAQPEDIVDPSTYSIQEAKVKSEKDREIEQAESKKQVVRNYIQDLRNEFIKLVSENDKQPASKQIRRQDLNVDPYLRGDVERDTLEKITNLHKEMAWISEKESIGPAKLRSKFLDPLQTERIELQAFETNRSVATFRTLKLDQNLDAVFQPLLAAAERGANSGTSGANNANARNTSAPREIEQLAAAEQEQELQPGDVPVAHKKTHKHHEVKSKLEVRKQLRAERAAMWKELMDTKPDEKYEDPKDVSAIRYAQSHMGDYKLKTADNYIVPESERIDADKKKRQIMLLRESINTLKEQFNKQVLKLRTTKSELVDTFSKNHARIDVINAELATLSETVEAKHKTYTLDPSAYPENRGIVSPSDIVLLQKEELEAAAHRGNHDDGLSGFGNGASSGQTGAGAAPPKADGAAATGQAKGAAPGATANAGAGTSKAAAGSGADESGAGANSGNGSNAAGDAEAGKSSAATLTPLELEAIEIKKMQLKYEKTEIHKSIERSIVAFDATIERLGKERIILEGDLKFADIKLLLLYQEWVLLKEFEKHDTALAEKLSTKKSEKAEIDIKIAECQEKLAAKKLDIEVVIVKEKEIQDEFQRGLGENNKGEEYLTKVFKRKVKRSKKKVKEGAGSKGDGEEGEEEEEEEDDDDDMDSSFGSDMDEEDEEFEERCPADCELALWTRVLELRDRRLDQDELLADIQKSVEMLRKENDSLIKKEKIIAMGLKNAEAEIQDFQTQKQRKLNELDVVVPLRFHQIQMLERNAMPVELSAALVFVNDGLIKLRNRIRELQQEKADIKKQHKELRKQHVSFIKSKKEKQQKLQELSDRARDVQMLKFGQIIDLEKLERLGVNKTADELREKLQREDNRRLKELHEWDGKINGLKERLTDITKENTLKLETLVQLKEQKYRLEDALNTSQASVTAEYSGPQKKDVIERDKLIALVQSQGQQIEALKEEIEMLIRKPMGNVPTVRGGTTKTAPLRTGMTGVPHPPPPKNGPQHEVVGVGRSGMLMPMTASSEIERDGIENSAPPTVIDA